MYLPLSLSERKKGMLHKTLNIKGTLTSLDTPLVMGILNVTPDSFYAGSRTPSAGEVERRALEAVGEGASIIDVGGYSSRPGADEVPPDEEWRRVELGVEAVRRLAPDTAVSVDTFRSGIAAQMQQRSHRKKR